MLSENGSLPAWSSASSPLRTLRTLAVATDLFGTDHSKAYLDTGNQLTVVCDPALLQHAVAAPADQYLSGALAGSRMPITHTGPIRLVGACFATSTQCSQGHDHSSKS